MPLRTYFLNHFCDHIRISTSRRTSSWCKAEVAAWNCFHLNFSSTSRWVWLSDDIYTSDWCCARGAPVYLISDETNRIGGCATARNGRCGKEKKEEGGKKRKGKKARKLAQSLSGASNPPPQQFPGPSVIRVYRILYLNL